MGIEVITASQYCFKQKDTLTKAHPPKASAPLATLRGLHCGGYIAGATHFATCKAAFRPQRGLRSAALHSVPRRVLHLATHFATQLRPRSSALAVPPSQFRKLRSLFQIYLFSNPFILYSLRSYIHLCSYVAIVAVCCGCCCCCHFGSMVVGAGGCAVVVLWLCCGSLWLWLLLSFWQCCFGCGCGGFSATAPRKVLRGFSPLSIYS